MAFIPHTERDVAEMLAAIGVSSIEQLFEEIPANLRTSIAMSSSLGAPPRGKSKFSTRSEIGLVRANRSTSL